MSASQVARFDKLKKLLSNDQTFADGFVAMGDFLALRGELNLAFLCLTRALELGHANDSEIRRRRRAILEEWENASDKRIRSRKSFWRTKIAKSEKVLKLARPWLGRFQAAEATLVKKGQFPSSAETLAEMASKKGSGKYRP
jgi:hypothetical protein